MLFSKLPDDLFIPLSSQNRYIYQAVLIELADLFFDEDLIDPFIPKDLVRSCIEDAVIKYGIRTWAPELDDDLDEESPAGSSHSQQPHLQQPHSDQSQSEQSQDSHQSKDGAAKAAAEGPRSTAEYTNRIYRRLVKTGWLDEEQQLYRTYVLMSPAVSYVLRTLIQVATFQKKSYGGAVLNVLSSVEAAIKDPEGRGLPGL